MNPIDSIGSTDVRPGRHVGPPDDPFGRLGTLAGTPAGTAGHPTEPSFTEALAAAANGNDLHLSGHALRRIEQRGIGLGQPEFDRLNGAFAQLAGKGGRQSLVLVDQVAYVVHVPSRTVVTAVAPDERNDSNVFTRIDSVVIA